MGSEGELAGRGGDEWGVKGRSVDVAGSVGGNDIKEGEGGEGKGGDNGTQTGKGDRGAIGGDGKGGEEGADMEREVQEEGGEGRGGED